MKLEQAQAFLNFLVHTSFADRVEIDWPHHRAYAEMPILLPEEAGGDGEKCVEYGRCNFVEVERSDFTASAAAEAAVIAFREELRRLHLESRKPDSAIIYPQFMPGEIGAIIWRARPKVRQNGDGSFTASMRFGLMSDRFAKHGAIPAE